MKSKLITLENLQRAIDWLDEAIQAIQNNTEGSLEDITDVSAAALNNLNNRVMQINDMLGDYLSATVDFSSLGTQTTTADVSFSDENRGYQSLSTDANITINITAENNGENYLFVRNTGSSNIAILIGTVNSLSSSSVYVPDGDIIVPAGQCVEVSIVAFDSMAVITTSDALVQNT